MSHFFVDRPVFAWVIALLIMLSGGIAVFQLPISQYPKVAPPVINVRVNYPGASAQTLEDTVTQVVEQKMNGLDNLLYMSSTSDSSGQATISLTFDPSVNSDIAQMQVQNKVQLATPSLPEEVKRQGVTVTKSWDSYLQMFAFISEDGSMTAAELSDFVATTLLDPLSRVSGVGEAGLFGAQSAMRIWLDPRKLLSYNMTPVDVVNAIKAQNTQVSVGQLGAKPIVEGQQINVTAKAQTRLSTPQEFRDILLRVNPDGSVISLSEVARVEIGQENYNTLARYNGRPAAGVAIQLAPDANALETSKHIHDFLEEMRPYFPKGVTFVSPYDTVPFVRISIKEVVKTLFEAIGLVLVVMYLFLQNIRATLIPTIAVPVVLLGTFGIMAVLGYSINTLTMFGLVLAIGLLVDDAIVVVENVERVMYENRLNPHEATYKTMKEISGALIGVAMVLSAVFIPMAFFGGATGVIYRQFSVTIVSAISLSVLVALVLTPALCATLLRQKESQAQGGFLGWFHRSVDSMTRKYKNCVVGTLHHGIVIFLLYVAITLCATLLYWHLPTSFLPDEDQGVMSVRIQLPSGATETETLKVVEQVERYLLEKEKNCIEGLMVTLGRTSGGGGRGQSTAQCNIRLRDWDERKTAEQHVSALVERSAREFSKIKNASIFVSAPPAIRGLGSATGFDFELQDRNGLGHGALIQAKNTLLDLASQDTLLTRVRLNGQDDTPQLQIDVDQRKAGAYSLSLDDVNDTLSTAWGGTYVNDFIHKSRVKKVYVQGDAAYRMLPEDLNFWYFRNKKGSMVPFTSFASARWVYGAMQLERFNGVSALRILGQAAKGVSSGTAMQEMEYLARQLPMGIGFQWTGMSFQERLSGAQAPQLYALSVLVVFLCLAALYESWIIPFSVILILPLGVFGSLLSTTLRGLTNDVYFQIGLLATIGLAAKNAILIVEFAHTLHNRGKSLVEAATEAARLRLRPILMTSFAFLLGVLPLVLSHGAGSGSQHSIGTGVFGGTCAATFLGIFFVPFFFVLIGKLKKKVTV